MVVGAVIIASSLSWRSWPGRRAGARQAAAPAPDLAAMPEPGS